MSWWLIVGQTAAAIFGATGLAQIVAAVARRRPTKVEAVDKLNETTLEWAAELKADAADARKEAREARVEAAEAHRQMAAVRVEAEQLASYLGRLVRAIHDPNITIDRLRAMVGDPGNNGIPIR